DEFIVHGLSPKYHCGGRNGRDAFTATDKTNLLIRRRLDGAALDVDRKEFGERLSHGLPVRTYLRRLGDDGNIGIHDRAAVVADNVCSMLQEDPGGNALPLRVRWREVIADIAGAAGGEQCVGQRM